jgi:hypothetical protein
MEPVTTTVATVSTWEAIKAAVIAIPKLIDGIRDGVNAIVGAINRHTEAVRDAKIEKIRLEQAEIRRAIEGIKNDADRAALVERISRLERGITSK